MPGKFLIKPLVVFYLVGLGLSGCSPSAVIAPVDSGIVGLVTLGPMCPVMQVGVPCPDKPYQATLSVFTSDGSREIAQFETDPHGYFTFDLSPGSYILHPEPAPSGIPHARDIPFTVQPHLFTKLEVIYDSGIR